MTKPKVISIELPNLVPGAFPVIERIAYVPTTGVHCPVCGSLETWLPEGHKVWTQKDIVCLDCGSFFRIHSIGENADQRKVDQRKVDALRRYARLHE